MGGLVAKSLGTRGQLPVGFQDPLTDWLVDFLRHGYDRAQPVRLPRVRDVQVDAQKDESMT